MSEINIRKASIFTENCKKNGFFLYCIFLMSSISVLLFIFQLFVLTILQFFTAFIVIVIFPFPFFLFICVYVAVHFPLVFRLQTEREKRKESFQHVCFWNVSSYYPVFVYVFKWQELSFTRVEIGGCWN